MMGLDMYLTVERSAYLFDAAEQDIHDKVVEASGIADLAYQDAAVLVRITVAYWHNAREIHSWMVDYVQDGLDDCRRYLVSWDHLEELLSAVSEVLDGAPPDEVMPIRGSSDLYYLHLRRTQEMLTKLLSRREELYRDGWTPYYQASW